MENLILIKTLVQLSELETYLKTQDFIAFDTETTGLNRDAEIIGFSVCADPNTAYYVILSYWDVEKQKLIYLETREGAKKFLSFLAEKPLVMHNAVFDCDKVLTNFGVDLMPSLHTDTMILAHLLDENRLVGLKDLGVSVFGDNAKKEQEEMKASIVANGGGITKSSYELYKADSDLIGKYGAKDTILTLKLFLHLIPELYSQGLEKFFYEEESMPLLKGPTYQLNTSGLRIDMKALQKLKGELEAECMHAKAYIYAEIENHVKDKYPGTKPTNTFNIGSSKQLSWLLFFKLNNEFSTLTQGGKDFCKEIQFPIPYSPSAKRQFIQVCTDKFGEVYQEPTINKKSGKLGRPKKVTEPWNYIACDKATLAKYAPKYKWVAKLLEYSKNLKLLNTYVEGIQSRAQYNVIYPSFLQHGTTSGRYSSRNPNFQNLPRKDKRIKSCIVSRPDNVFVGADYSQLEPRVFASLSNDPKLIQCFKAGDDFYSVIGVEVFDKHNTSLKKDDKDSFANKHPDLRDISKAVALSATYGTTAFKMAPLIGKHVNEAQDVINKYFERFPSVLLFMLQCHNKVKADGAACNLFGRLRRLPEAKKIEKIYGNSDHAELPYAARTLLNLGVNHTVQSTGASIMNRAAIACHNQCTLNARTNPEWKKVKIVLQIHDELVLEGPQSLAQEISQVLKIAMENTTVLPNVALVAEPKIGKTLAELK